MKKPTTHRRKKMQHSRRNVVDARIRVKYPIGDRVSDNAPANGFREREFAGTVVWMLDSGFSVRELKRMVNTCAEIMDN